MVHFTTYAVVTRFLNVIDCVVETFLTASTGEKQKYAILWFHRRGRKNLRKRRFQYKR
jgi:hypothetical protein